MREIVSTITSKGQVTIPVEIRRHLGIATNDKVAFVLEDGGEVRLKPPAYRRLADLRGAAGTLKTPLTWEQIHEIARDDHLAEKFPSDL